MGAKSLKEIIEAINLLVLQPAPAAQSSHNEDSVYGTDEFCLCIVQEVVKTIGVHAGNYMRTFFRWLRIVMVVFFNVFNCGGR